MQELIQKLMVLISRISFFLHAQLHVGLKLSHGNKTKKHSDDDSDTSSERQL